MSEVLTQVVSIRKINPLDAEAFLELMHKIDAETTFMLFEPGERTETVEGEKAYLKKMLDDPKRMIFLGEDQGRLVGYIGCMADGFRRTAHVATVVIGILQSHVGKGLGTRFFKEMEMWARKTGLHRLELNVDDNNEAGIALYKKMGFEIEGHKKDAKRIEETYRDELLMAKIL